MKGNIMFLLDGKPVDVTKPQTWDGKIKIAPNGFIEQRKDGVTTKVQPVPQPKEKP